MLQFRDYCFHHSKYSFKGKFRIADLFDKNIDSKSLNNVIDELGTDIWVFESNAFKCGNIKIFIDNGIILQVNSEDAENKKDEN